MRRFILAFSMFSVWLAIASTYYTCVIKGICDSSENIEETPKVVQKPIVQKPIATDNVSSHASAEKTIDSLAITEESKKTSIDTLKISGLKIYDNSSLLKAYYSNFKIYQNSTKVRIPLGISEYGYVIAKHMDSLDSALTIKGYYNQEETAEKGLQRADFIKERLTKLGVPETLITTKAVQAIYDYNYNKFTGGIQFDFKKTDSVFRLKRVDYTLFKNRQEKVETNIELDTLETEVITTTNDDPKISDAAIASITKKDAEEVASAEAKKETTPVVKKEKIRFTVTNKDFRNNKFKASKSFKNFIETHKAAKSIQLYGYSNANENPSTNYSKGLELANLVKSYITEKGIYGGKTTTNASKNETLAVDDIKEGVTLIIQ